VTDIKALAEALERARTTATAVPQLSLHTQLTLEEAYAVQAAGIESRASHGDTQVGLKLGFTSKAKALQMGVDDLIIGVLTRDTEVEDGGEVDLARFIHPRVEPEVAFRLGSAVDPTDPECDAHAAVSDVAPALEVIDSRYADFKFSLADVIADNTSAAAFVVGPWRPYAETRAALDLADLEVTLSFGDAVVGKGSTADILGDPTRALDDAVRLARAYGLTLPAGSIILAGAATAASAMTPATSVTAVVEGLGQVSLRTRGTAR
jgi:2-oxo-3-hexenedioate decarboxylase